jgi:hypothetical protein
MMVPILNEVSGALQDKVRIVSCPPNGKSSISLLGCLSGIRFSECVVTGLTGEDRH